MHVDTPATVRALVGRGLRTAVRVPFTRRAWGEVAYCLAGFPLAVVGFALVVVLLALGCGLTATLVGAVLGLTLLVVAVALARGLAGLRRGLATALLGERLAAPGPAPRGAGAFARLDARLRDTTGWRAVAYAAASLPVAAVGAYAVSWWVCALVNVTAPVRWAVFGQRPERPGESMPVLVPTPAGGMPHVSTFGGTFLAVAAGFALLLAAPWLTRGVVAVDRRLMRALLVREPLAARVRALEETRALAVDDSAALLRKLERDLHDGAQVRLVALAMTLDMAKERAGDEGGVPPDEAARLRTLLGTAHLNATEALTELRDLARGIHPPALDEGLPDALATLTANSAIPVTLTVDVPERPTQAIETIAYFCAAELLTNVIKHSGAGRARITLRGERGALVLRVADEGHGGAEAGAGSGLAGLVQRVRTVDGSVAVLSPPGGPTEVTVTLPFRA